MTNELSHMNAIEYRLSNERIRRDMATTAKEVEWREHNIKMIERELEGEIAFLKAKGVEVEQFIDDEMSIDDILDELDI